MPKVCCVPTCKVRSDDLDGLKKTFHTFPADKVLREKWEQQLKAEFVDLSLPKYSYVCSSHFNADCFYFTGLCTNLRLKKGSYPSIFPNLKYNKLKSQFVKEDTRLLNNTNSQVVDAADNEQLDHCTDKEPNNLSKDSQSESDGESDLNISTSVPQLPGTEILTEADVSESNHPSEKVTSRVKSLIDLDVESLDVPKEVKDILHSAKAQMISLRRKNKSLQMKLYRWKKGVKTGNSLLAHLKHRKYINENIIDSLKESLPSHAYQIFRRLLRKPSSKTPFPPALKSFATTLHFYSPKTYNYVRNAFMKCLPHPMNISKWYKNINCSSGISEACIDAVKRKVQFHKSINNEAEVFCNLVMDEMKIKKKIEVINGNEYGYIDIGKENEEGEMLEAENALVFMLVCVNGGWKIAVSYYFVKALSGEKQAELTKEILTRLSETGVKITSVTFDGLQSNFTMCKYLGATISAENPMKAHFPHPISKESIFIVPDGCHALKLIRNAFAHGDMYDGDGNIISWDFLKKLVDVQEFQGLHLGTKIRRQHIDFYQNKMNVRLAAQTLSESSSVALRYMRDDLQCLEFQNVEGTAKFCSIINAGFDILNSREHYNKNKSKNGIDANNIKEIAKKVEDITDYIKHLRTAEGSPVVNCARKTGFVGMIIALHNVLRVYKTFIKPLNGYLLTYKLSQDHLEIFFSSVRSKGGYSNNPTCYQFNNILKKLLVHADVKESKYANCTSLDKTCLLHVSSKREETKTEDKVILETDNVLSENDDFYGKGKNKKYIDNTVIHIAGFVTRTILKKSRCFQCPLVLTSEVSHSTLTEKKNRGGLLSPSVDVINVCKIVEKNFRLLCTSKRGMFNTLFQSIISNMLHSLLQIQHSEDPSKHRSFILKKIIFTYLRVRVNHYESEKSRANKKIRRIFTKMILFRNE